MRIEKITCAVLHEARERQVEEFMNVFSEGPEGMYVRPYRSRARESTLGTDGYRLRHRGYRCQEPSLE